MSGDQKKSSYRARQRGLVEPRLDREYVRGQGDDLIDVTTPLSPQGHGDRILEMPARNTGKTLRANDAMRLALEARTRP